MRFLPHHSDCACPNGGCFGALSQLWSDCHFSLRRTSSGAAMDAPGRSRASAVLATCTSLPDAGRAASPRHGYAHLAGKHRPAPQTRTWAAPSHDLDQRLRQSDALGRRAGRASRHALGRFPCRTARRRNTQSVPPHSRIPSSTKHDTAEQCRRRHDGNALIPACGLPAWERSFRGAFATNDAAAPGQRRYVLEPGGRHAL